MVLRGKTGELLNISLYCIIYLVTKTKKALLGGVLAVCTLASSWMFWTSVVERNFGLSARLQTAQKIDYSTSPLRGSVFGSLVVEENVIIETEEVGEVDEEVEVEMEVVMVEEEHEAAEEIRDSELEEWGLRPVYRLSIPSIGVRSPVLLPSREFWDIARWDLLEKQQQKGLLNGAVLYPHSVLPGELGAMIIAGHSSPPTEEAEESKYGHLFARLPEVERGDTISVLSAGVPVTYKVENKTVVSPHQTSILEQNYDESILKLITCYPVGTTQNRMIVIAKKEG